jgi:hypothetical protein
MELRDWLIVASTLLGPVLAVQAQAWVERIRERRGRKTWLFTQLMATRAARLSAEHVQALNMIDLVFFGRRVFGITRRSKAEQRVLDAWKEYHDQLSNRAPDEPLQSWATKNDELFTNLLFQIALDTGYTFDRVQLKKGAYSPVAHGDLEQEQTQLRRGILKIIDGNAPLKMEVTGFPSDPDARKAMLDFHLKVAGAISPAGALKIQPADPGDSPGAA